MPLHIVSLDPAGAVELGGQLTVHLEEIDAANPGVGNVTIKRIAIDGTVIPSGQWSAYNSASSLEIVIYQIPQDIPDTAEPLLEITYGAPNVETETLECPLQLEKDLSAVPADNNTLTVRQPVRLWSQGLNYIRGSGFPDQKNPGRLTIIVSGTVVTNASIRVISSNLLQFRFAKPIILTGVSSIKVTRTLDNGKVDSVSASCRGMA